MNTLRLVSRHTPVKRLALATALACVAGLMLCEAAFAAGEAPVTFVTTPPQDTNQPTATFQFTGEGGFQCSLNGATATSCTATTYLKGLPQGENTFVVEDECGDSGCATASAATYTWTTDYTPPDVKLTSQPASVTNQTTASFGFSSTDPTATFQCSLNGGAYAACTSPSVYSGLSAGTRQFNVEAVDPAGNVSLMTGAATWTVDLTPPDTAIISTPPKVTNTTSATFTFDSSESGSTFLCSLDGEPFGACSSPLTLGSAESAASVAAVRSHAAGPTLGGPLPAGSHTFAVEAVDAAGNVDPTPAQFTWTIQTALPPAPTLTLAGVPASFAFKPRPIHARSDRAPRTAGPPLSGTRPYLPAPSAAPKSLGTWTTAQQTQLYWSDPDPTVQNIDYATWDAYLGLLNNTPTPAPAAAGIQLPLVHGPNCFGALAIDDVGNQSPLTLACTNVFFDWADLNNLGEYFLGYNRASLGTGIKYYDDSYQVLSHAAEPFFIGQTYDCGTTAIHLCVRTGSPLSGLAILATTCPTCGSFRVVLSGNQTNDSSEFGGRPQDASYSRVISLKSATTKHQQIFVLPKVAGTTNNAFLWLQAVTGKPQIEGVGIDQTNRELPDVLIDEAEGIFQSPW
jgi:hypothetical protein